MTIFIIILCLSFIYVYKNQPKYDSKLLKRLHLDNYKFIAHAGGGIDQYIYTNSKEAIYKSIKIFQINRDRFKKQMTKYL